MAEQFCIVVSEEFRFVSEFGVFSHEVSALILECFEFLQSVIHLRIESFVFDNVGFVFDHDFSLSEKVTTADSLKLKLHLAQFFFQLSL